MLAFVATYCYQKPSHNNLPNAYFPLSFVAKVKSVVASHKSMEKDEQWGRSLGAQSWVKIM